MEDGAATGRDDRHPEVRATLGDPARRADILRALGDPVRFAALQLLRERPCNFTEICRELGRPRSSTSHHLAQLRGNGLVAGRRRGQSVVYHLTELGDVVARAVVRLADVPY